MQTRDLLIASAGEELGATLYTPEGDGPFPMVVMAGGWCYVKEIVMPHHAAKIVAEGVACLSFDYRGFGASTGTPRQHIDPWAQIEDYRNAITFAETLEEVDPDRIGAWGISYSGGHVLILAAIEPRLRCVVSNIPVVDGWENMRRVHGERRFKDLRERLLQDRRKRCGRTTGADLLPMSCITPDTTLSTWPFASIFEGFERIRCTEAPRHRHESTVESTEQLLTYSVFPFLPRILGPACLMVVAEGDEITLWDREVAAFDAIPGTQKKLVILPDVSHMSLYSERSHLEIAAAEGAAWLARQLTDVAVPQVAVD
jgi:pimeloyl-ACP methyl ester carboxylesterase